MTYNSTLFELINGLSNVSPSLDLLMIFFAEVLIYIIPAVGFSLWYRKNDLWKKLMWGTLAAASISYIISGLLNFPRPGLLEFGRQLTVHSFDGSFPSDHTATMFGAAASIRKDKNLFRLLLVLATLTGFARIFIGVHFPLDILAGAILGFSIPVILDKVSK